MTEIDKCDSTIRPGSKSLDLETITRQSEAGNTKLLESSLNCAASFRERSDVLAAVQGLNAQHRLQEPEKHLPVLSLEVRQLAGVRGKTELSLNLQEYKQFAIPQPLFQEHNWRSYSGSHREVVKDSTKR